MAMQHASAIPNYYMASSTTNPNSAMTPNPTDPTDHSATTSPNPSTTTTPNLNNPTYQSVTTSATTSATTPAVTSNPNPSTPKTAIPETIMTVTDNNRKPKKARKKKAKKSKAQQLVEAQERAEIEDSEDDSRGRGRLSWATGNIEQFLLGFMPQYQGEIVGNQKRAPAFYNEVVRSMFTIHGWSILFALLVERGVALEPARRELSCLIMFPKKTETN